MQDYTPSAVIVPLVSNPVRQTINIIPPCPGLTNLPRIMVKLNMHWKPLRRPHDIILPHIPIHPIRPSPPPRRRPIQLYHFPNQLHSLYIAQLIARQQFRPQFTCCSTDFRNGEIVMRDTVTRRIRRQTRQQIFLFLRNCWRGIESELLLLQAVVRESV